MQVKIIVSIGVDLFILADRLHYLLGTNAILVIIHPGNNLILVTISTYPLILLVLLPYLHNYFTTSIILLGIF